MTVVVQTDRLRLRELVVADAPALEAVFGDEEVMRFGDGPHSAPWIVAWIGEAQLSYRRHGYGPWAVVGGGADVAIGYCGLSRFPNINGRAETEIGFRLARPHWNLGLGTEAAMAVRDLAFAGLGLTRLVALIDPDNTRSLRVAEKLGMTLEGRVMLEGYDHPDLLYVCEPT